jgi:hypothetical protein
MILSNFLPPENAREYEKQGDWQKLSKSENLLTSCFEKLPPSLGLLKHVLRVCFMCTKHVPVKSSKMGSEEDFRENFNEQ